MTKKELHKIKVIRAEIRAKLAENWPITYRKKFEAQLEIVDKILREVGDG